MPKLFDSNTCAGCSVRMPSDTWEESLSLDAKLSDAPHIAWPNGKTWKRKLLYGETHTIHTSVIAGDGFTHRDYAIVIERTCPWYMRADVMRAIAYITKWTSIIGGVVSGGQLIALAKQLQFLRLTSDVNDVPEAYGVFAKETSHIDIPDPTAAIQKYAGHTQIVQSVEHGVHEAYKLKGEYETDARTCLDAEAKAAALATTTATTTAGPTVTTTIAPGESVSAVATTTKSEGSREKQGTTTTTTAVSKDRRLASAKLRRLRGPLDESVPSVLFFANET